MHNLYGCALWAWSFTPHASLQLNLDVGRGWLDDDDDGATRGDRNVPLRPAGQAWQRIYPCFFFPLPAFCFSFCLFSLKVCFAKPAPLLKAPAECAAGSDKKLTLTATSAAATKAIANRLIFGLPPPKSLIVKGRGQAGPQPHTTPTEASKLTL